MEPCAGSASGELLNELKPKKLGFGALALSYAGLFRYPRFSYRAYILVLTFVVYAAYHMSRKPFSVVAIVMEEVLMIIAPTLPMFPTSPISLRPLVAGPRSPRGGDETSTLPTSQFHQHYMFGLDPLIPLLQMNLSSPCCHQLNVP
ncbi:hypothetical protein GBAR_LOCUS15418 [Geodia barretti]|uniref:Uncharacterized protein n=1 Tax=Geodia barretti TaxID=519541 RepID=A0AA35WU87_GEOBA|nr:hypothetical protein GBAR_LOCUS15418 [Geodia barretti]